MAMTQIPRTRGDPLPDTWYSTIERGKEKAKKFIKQVIAIDQNTSVVVGKLTAVEIDKLFKTNSPFVRLNMFKSFRYRQDGSFECKLADEELFFVNKPQMIMTMDELREKFPKVYDEILGKVKKGVWD